MNDEQRYLPYEAVKRIQYAEDGSNWAGVLEFLGGDPADWPEHQATDGVPGLNIEPGQWVVLHDDDQVEILDDDPTVTLAEADPTEDTIAVAVRHAVEAWQAHQHSIVRRPRYLDFGGFVARHVGDALRSRAVAPKPMVGSQHAGLSALESDLESRHTASWLQASKLGDTPTGYIAHGRTVAYRYAAKRLREILDEQPAQSRTEAQVEAGVAALVAHRAESLSGDDHTQAIKCRCGYWTGARGNREIQAVFARHQLSHILAALGLTTDGGGSQLEALHRKLGLLERAEAERSERDIGDAPRNVSLGRAEAYRDAAKRLRSILADQDGGGE